MESKSSQPNQPLESQTESDEGVSGAIRVAPGDVVIGNLVGITPTGKALVSFQAEGDNFSSLIAKSTQALDGSCVGREVALMFIQQNLQEPIITGFIHSDFQSVLDLSANFDNQEDRELFSANVSESEPEPVSSARNLSFEVDGQEQHAVFEASKELVLKCGDASITLTNQGKIILRGKYILSRSSGVQRIQGATVQVN